MSKKAQTAVFVIIALIIVVTAGTIFFVQRESSGSATEGQASEKPEFAGQAEVRSYVDSCLQDAVLEGLEIIRLQSGYIVVPEDMPSLKVKDPENREVRLIDGSVKVVIDPDGAGNNVPYWITKDSYNVPRISTMESQLERYVLVQMEDCINGFQPLKDRAMNITYGSITPNVEMGNAVAATLDFPIRIVENGIEVNENEFVYTVPINMKLVVDRASELADFQDRTSFLEDHTKNLISLYSGADENSLPPYSQTITNFDCSSSGWSKDNVKKHLKSIFKENTGLLKVAGTKFNLIRADNPEMQGVYESFVHSIFETQNPSLEIGFSYRPEWEFLEYDIAPSSGDSIVPSRVVQTIPLVATLCVFEYTSKYTIDYPILTEINDVDSAGIDIASKTLNDDGYNFQFAMESFICGNQKRECVDNAMKLDFSALNEEYEVLPESMFCDQEQRINDLSINVLDYDANQGIENAEVFYYCGSYRNNCLIGRTDSAGMLKTKIPSCVNGKLYSMKKDYVSFEEALSVNNEAKSGTYHMDRLREVNANVKKVFVPAFVRNYHETGNLSPESSLSGMLEKESASVRAIGPSQIFYDYPVSKDEKIKLGPGSYDLNIAFNGVVDIAPFSSGNMSFGRQQGNFPFGNLNLKWNIPRNEIKDNVTFFALSNFDSSKVISANPADIKDPILDFEGKMSAELLYKCERNETACTDRCSFVGIDGTLFDDYHDEEFPSCMESVDVSISKEQYESVFRPRFG